MNNEKREIREALEKQFFNCDDSNCFICSNDNGCIIVGNSEDVYSSFIMLARQLRDNIKDDERFKSMLELIFKSKKEIEKEALNKIKDFIEKYEKEI